MDCAFTRGFTCVVATDGAESSGNMNQNEYAELVNELISNGATAHIMLLSTRGGVVPQPYIDRRMPQ